EVRLEAPPCVPLRLLEVAILALVAIGEDVRVIEDEIEALERIDHARGGSHPVVTGRLVSRQGEVLMRCVRGNREEARRAPLERLLFVLVGPNRRGAMALQDIDGLLVDVLDRI